jgi:hypothetical protein
MITLSPEEILTLEPEGADELLGRLEGSVPVSPGLVELDDPRLREAIVFGDSHGDWRTTVEVARRFLESPSDRCLIGLGDYVDRAPADCEEGSVANALYLLGLAAQFPGHVYLIQGNHESNRRVPVLPHDLPEEVDLLWGPEESRYYRILSLLERGPLAVRTSNGAFLSHGGFPLTPGHGPIAAEFQSPDDEAFLEIVWGECAAAHAHRGIVRPFDERDMLVFLRRCDARIVLRGHDPEMAGRVVYGGRCLTLHTSRLYERYGGILLARLPLDRPVHTVADLTVERLAPSGGPVEPNDERDPY